MTAEPRRARPRWRRRLLFIAIALLVALTVTAALLELGFRLFWQLPPQYAMFDEVGLYDETADGHTCFRPGFRGVLEARDTRTELAVNALGMRGDEVGDKRPGELRVLVLGDSMVFGFMVDQDHSLPALLATELAARGRPATVGNGGIPGFGTKHMVEHMAWLDPKFEPDAFVFCSSPGNDPIDDMRIDLAVCGGLRFDGPMARLVRTSRRFRLAVHSRAWLWLETWIFVNHPSWSPLTTVPPNSAEVATMAGLPGKYPGHGRAFAGLFLDWIDEQHVFEPGTSPVIPRVYANIRASFERAQAIAAGRPLVFAVLPTLWQFDDAARAERLPQLGFDPARLEKGLAIRRWVAVGEQLSVPTIDVTPPLAAAPDHAALFVDGGGHYSRAGGEIVARAIADALAPLLR
ncbi:MAG: hypothetical protein KDE27_24610 [Planctomycetes bacterium]|nr:hypothetical protein [Planctomycetota bacterium]